MKNIKEFMVNVLNQNRTFTMLNYHVLFKTLVNFDVKKLREADVDQLNINVGAGSFSHPDWINLDKVSPFYRKMQTNRVIDWDLLEKTLLPFPDNSINLIYTSHVIEHLPNDVVDFFFSQSHLKLKPGTGGIRIVCPDFNLLFEAYKRKDPSVFLCN